MRRGAHVFAIVNQKGGVGKTTTAVNLSTALAMAGKRVLLVDSDPQGNATTGLGIDKRSLQASLYDVLVDAASLSEIIRKDASVPGLDLAPATLDLSGAEMEMIAQISRETILRRALEPVLSHYDFVVLDAPPSLGLLTLNVLTAATAVIIPIQCEFYALEGISQLLTVIDRVRGHLNPKLSIGMVVMTMHDERVNVSRQVVADVRAHFREKVARTVVPRNVRLSEAPSFGQPIALYDARSKGAAAYAELAQEVLALG
jgi:chromosome partitioning protein